ncbi:hypothetical protein RhiJN_16666 [Ceratobasidium sp. AG-Ba]|nr:hypothetical protein RhiJN_16666 [Ceratobasidium sp. AG-Ba]
MASSQRLLCLLLLGLSLRVSAHPLERYPPPVGGNELVGRQQASTATSLVSSVTQATSRAPTAVTRSQVTTQSRSSVISLSSTPTSSQVVSVTSPGTTTSSRSSAVSTSTQTSSISITSSNPSSTSPSSTSATTSPTNTSTSGSRGIFSKDSPYYSYAIAVTVVVAIFSFLLLVLFIRFLVQCFTKKPKSKPIFTNLGAREQRYSEESDLHSTRHRATSSYTVQTTPDMRHKDLQADTSERRAFLSTEDVTLYAPGNQNNAGPIRYNDEEPAYPTRARSFSGSSGSGPHTAVPFVSRRPATMSFLHSPPATNPAFIVDPGSESGHSEEIQGQLKSVPEEPAAFPNATSNLLLARATHSNAYRQQTLASGTTDLSRAASTASAYSQISTYSAAPPVPQMPVQHTPPNQPQLSPDLSAALSSMRGRTVSMDSTDIDTIKTTAPPTEEGTVAPSAAVARPRPGRAGWPGRAPASIHGPDLYFGH